MKKLFSLALLTLMMVASRSFAQSSLLATLSHEGEISTFYGANALKNAHSKAVAGDAITLSSGTFVATNITKPIILRGAGMVLDSINNIAPTIIAGDFTINVTNTDNAKLTIEGIYNSSTISILGLLTNATFLKCRFKEINFTEGSGPVTNLLVIHCKVVDRLSVLGGSSITMINSYLKDVIGYRHETIYCQFENCVLYWSGDNLYAGHANYTQHISAIGNSTFKNCIIFPTPNDNNHIIPASSSAYNCISFKSSTFQNIPNTTNSFVTGWDTIFKTFRGTYNDLESFELTDAAKAKYKGTDGTEVGIHGGSLPFSATPSNPQITKCNVAAKSTADGKLSVDIEVAGAE